ncbi:MAG: heavy metal translocating P-type ATPase [Desulfovibrionaceae bacterium]|nr:heavy metal translocating P-type ATPase [Desulfovibrionaceae bacterium]
MTFSLVHELTGLHSETDGRMRIRANAAFPRSYAFDLEQKLNAFSGVRAEVNARTGSVLIFYETCAARTQALNFLQEEERIPVRSRCVAEKGDGGSLFPLFRYIFIRPLLPQPVRMGLAVFGALPFLFKGIGELFRGKLSVEVLDASAILASLAMGDFRTVSMLTLLLGLGDTLALWTKQHSLASLTESLTLNVHTVWRKENGKEVATPLAKIKPGDLVVVRAGSSIPVDGVVAEGVAVVNQSSMTGEPIGVKREEGGAIFAGTAVEEGEIVVRVTKVGDETRFRQVAAFIEESEALKAGIQGKSERLADIAVPFTFGLAGLVYLLTRNFMRAASVLLVDYSCALKLATPLAVLTAMREGTQLGMVIKGGRYLEALSDADTVVFDKTGTLTNASPAVADVIPCAGHSRSDILRIMACLEEHFPHPVARAVVAKAQEEHLVHEEEHAHVEYIVAHGIASSLHNKRLCVGSRHYIEHDEKVDLSPLQSAIEEQSGLGRSLLFMSEDGKLAGMLAIEDPLRKEAVSVIKELRELGFSRVVMLTGDDERTAAAIAKRAGITSYRSQVLPTDKAHIVEELESSGAKVLMVGDGINDAPALSKAHVGIAMIDGTDLAREVANVLLTRPDLRGLVAARLLARSTMRRIHVNFAATLLLNSLFLAGGLFSLLPAGTSAVLHNLTTLGIALNALRPHLASFSRRIVFDGEESGQEALPA